MIHVLFTDGTVITGATYRAAEDSLRASQFSSFPSRRAFRRELRRRVTVWSGAKAPGGLKLTSKSFLHSLADAGLCRVEKVTSEGFLV